VQQLHAMSAARNSSHHHSERLRTTPQNNHRRELSPSVDSDDDVPDIKKYGSSSCDGVPRWIESQPERQLTPPLYLSEEQHFFLQQQHQHQLQSYKYAYRVDHQHHIDDEFSLPMNEDYEAPRHSLLSSQPANYGAMYSQQSYQGSPPSTSYPELTNFQQQPFPTKSQISGFSSYIRDPQKANGYHERPTGDPSMVMQLLGAGRTPNTTSQKGSAAREIHPPSSNSTSLFSKVRSLPLVIDHRKAYDQPVHLGDEVTSESGLLKGRRSTSFTTARAEASGRFQLLKATRRRSKAPSKSESLKSGHRRFHSDGSSLASCSTANSKGAKQHHPLLRPSASNFAREGSISHHHRRLSSTDAASSLRGLPPVAPSSKATISPHHHRRSSSRTSIGDAIRRRADSFSSALSLTSSATVASYVTDVTRSSLFKCASENGMAEFHLPKDNIHIITDQALEQGFIYKEQNPDENDCFVEYYLFATGVNNSWQDFLDDDDELVNTGCTCNCNNCANYKHHRELLPPNRFAIVVEDDLYKRVLKEVADSQRMPFGLYFCGHHEDVDKPNIMIAVVLIVIFFGGMAAVACSYNDPSN
jgi:hypothetical protein